MAHLPERWNADLGRMWDPGVVTLGRFTIPALLPVHDADMVPTAEMVKTDALYVSARLGKCWIDSEYEDDLPLDPLPRPGQFIARPERAA